MPKGLATSDDTSWRTWSAAKWSERLFKALFVEGDHSEPVAHIPATPHDLQKLTGDPGADPDAVAAQFVDALRRHPKQVKALLSNSSAEWRTWARAPSPSNPPVNVAYLFLTCYVAAGGEEETFSQGRFAKRLRVLLGHDDGSFHYQTLPKLDRLWEEFAHRLGRLAETGACRSLELPPKEEYRKYLSYSYQLAFPTLWERRLLVDKLQDLRGEEPSVESVLKRMREVRVKVGSRLAAYLADFECQYAEGRPNLRSHPFWVAVRDATAHDFTEEARGGLRLGLVIPTPGSPTQLLLFASSRGPLPDAVSVVPEGEVESYDGLVSVEGVPDPAKALLDESAPPLWEGASGTPLVSCIRQDGVVLFARDESGWPVSRFSLPDHGEEAWLLAWEGRARAIPKYVPKSAGDGGGSLRPSIYDGWWWLHFPDATPLHEVSGLFPDVRCLQPAASGPAFRLSGGVREGRVHLGAPEVLPAVVPRKSVGVTCVKRVSLGTGAETVLSETDGGRFEETMPTPLSGVHAYVAYDRRGREVGRSRVRFVDGVVGADFKGFKDPGRFTAESTGPETARWNEACAAAAGTYPYGPVVPASNEFGGATFGRLLGTEVQSAGRVVPDGRWSTFVEVASAYSCRRAGLGEHELLGLLTDVLGVPRGPLLWEVARAWVESGAFDLVTPTTFPARRYAARRPQLVASNDGLSATLVGLVPGAIRRRLEVAAEDVGLEVEELPSTSPWVAPLLRFSSGSPPALESFVERSGLGAPAPLRPLEEVVPSPVAISKGLPVEPPDGHTENGEWNWEWGGYGHVRSEGVALVRYQRSRAPDRYLVRQSAARLCFQSHTWALLWALASRGEPAFAYDDCGRLVGLDPSQPHLPIPVARALACTAGPAGPLTRADGSIGYAYPTTPMSRRVLAAAWFGVREAVPPPADRLARFILRRDHHVSRATVPVPPRLVRRLKPFAHHARIGAVCDGRFPPTLMPHVTHLASILNAND